MSPRKRKTKRNRESNPRSRVRIVSVAEMMAIREQLEEVSKPGTDPFKQAAVITLAAQLQGAYYYAGRSLRRVFPKPSEVVLFHGVPQSASAQKMLASFSPVEGVNDAADQSQADPVRDQQ